jgi:hypothetical protein
MADIRITFPEGAAWFAAGLGCYLEESQAASVRAGGGGQCFALLEAIQPVLEAEPGEEPQTLPNGYTLLGWDGDALVYTLD